MKLEMHLDLVDSTPRKEYTSKSFVREQEELTLEANEPENTYDSYVVEDEPYEIVADIDEYEDDYYVTDDEEGLDELFDGCRETYNDEDVNAYIAKINRSQLEDEEDEEYDERVDDFGWLRTDSNDEDTWWALTDGMYGECPRNPIAFDAALEALGF